MTVGGLVPILLALCLLFIPLLSDGPPGSSKARRRRIAPEPRATDGIGALAGPKTNAAISMRYGCHLHGLPPQLNQLHRDRLS